MQKVKINDRTNGVVEYRATGRPATVKPDIKRTFYVGKGKERTRMYETTDGREFLADTFDRVFIPAVRFKVHGKGHRSKSIDPRHID